MKKESVRSLFIKELAFFMSLPAYVWVIIFFYIPLTLICWRSVVHVLPNTFFSLAAYQRFFSFPYLKIISQSLILATTTAILCLCVAYPLAYYVALKCQAWSKRVLIFLLTLPFAVNILVQAYAWFFVLENTGLINSLLSMLGIINSPIQLLYTRLAVVIVMLYCYLPFMIMPIYSSLEKIDLRLIEASYDLGASWRQTFAKIIVPLSMPGIRLGFLLVYIAAFGEFVIPALLGGNKYMYVGSLISYLFLTINDDVLGSAFTCFSCMILLVCVLLIFWRFKKIESWHTRRH